MENRSIASVAAQNITLRRKALGLTQAQVANKIEGVDKLMTSRHLCAIRLHERKTAMP